MTFLPSISFYIFAAILIFAGVRVITAKNPVHAALYLVLCFFTSGAIWMLLQAEFLAIAIVLVYVGAVMVLFLFVVMMLDINIEQLRKGFWRHLPSGLFVGLIMVTEMILVLNSAYAKSFATPLAVDANNTQALAKVLYTQYVYPFELASLILTCSMVAAVALTYRSRKVTKRPDPAEQIAVKSTDRLRVVKMPAQTGE